jgi:hypothetical protein
MWGTRTYPAPKVSGRWLKPSPGTSKTPKEPWTGRARTPGPGRQLRIPQPPGTAASHPRCSQPGFNPTSSGGPQGGSGAENVVIGNFQEKPQFARDAGLDPAQRYTVEGNTEIYLRTLAHHRNDPGDIFDHLLATSSGGPMATGGRAKMAQLMSQTRDLLTGTSSI